MSIDAANYGWNAHVPHSCAYLFDPVIELLRGLGARRVLDLGCGNGHLAGGLKQRGWDVVGVDPDAGGVALARSSFPEVRFYRTGVSSDPTELLSHEAPFEAVVSTEVIEHLYAPRLLPIYAARVLGPRGHLILTTPYHGYWKNLAVSLFDRWDHHHTALWEGGHVKFFSRATLTRLLEENGFEVTGFHGVGRLPWLWKSMALVARKR